MAFEEIYRRHNKKVYTFLSKRLKSKNDIEDIYQSVFIKIHKSRKSYNPDFDLLKWIYVISRSELYDACKKRKLKLIQLNDDFSYESADSQDEIEFDIDLSKEKQLSPNEKKALELRYLEDREFSEISNTLKTTEQNSRKIISRGLAKLKKKYKGKMA